MIEYKKVLGTQDDIPKELEINVDTVYVRYNLIKIDENDFIGWQYDEKQYSLKEYISLIGELEKKDKEIEDSQMGALIAQAETFELVIKNNIESSLALAELMEMIMSGGIR